MPALDPPAPTAPPAPPFGVLRAPQQARSREKVTRILAATARLLAERPYQEIGTKLIAAEAGVSVGVLYRFFPDKEAIVLGLAVQWLDEFTVLITQELSAPLPADPRALAARLLAAQVRFRREQAGFRQLWFNGPPLPALRAHDDRSDRTMADAIRAVLVDHYGLPDSPAFALRVELVVTTVGGLLNEAFRHREEGDPAILAEIQVMLDRWLFALPDDTGQSH
ncbi:TetR family transcriptional regulator [Kitasatospora nipponensis]|uniref:TetR family transcriptional regulator n=1 Tax=Kitasatospora nipponensis TaxID=258049 RepID=A0ABN1X1K3_9ACTN